MIPSLFDIAVVILAVAAGIALTAWFSRDVPAASGGRIMNMLAHAGVAPDIAGRGDAVMREVRSRCRRCRSEDLCDKWLAGEFEGDIGFCPNAQIFRGLAGERAAA